MADVLDWIGGAGFAEVFEEYDNFPYKSAHEFRQRYLTQALRGLQPVR